MTGEQWAPGLSDVARHLPRMTRDSKTPGSDKLLGTFTASTTPSDAQAQQVIDDCVAVILADVGQVPATLVTVPEIQVAYRAAVEWRAAADIELAYRNRDADVSLYAQLDARAHDALAMLREVLSEAGAGIVDSVPEWAMPRGVPWGDISPGSGTESVYGPVVIAGSPMF